MTTHDDINARAQLSDRLALMRALAGAPPLSHEPMPQPRGSHGLRHWLGVRLMRLSSRLAARPSA